MNSALTRFVSVPAYLIDNVAKMNAAWESDHVRETPGFPDFRQLFIRIHLIQEELTELADSIRNDDTIETLDALGDLDVVIAGTWICLGWRQARNTGHFIVINTDALPRRLDLGLALTVVGGVMSCLSVLAQAFADQDIEKCLDSLRKMDYHMSEAWCWTGMAAMREEVSAEILRSNLSKLDPVTGKVIKSAAGRVKKGPAYSEPDLRSIFSRRRLAVNAAILAGSDGPSDGEAPCGCAQPSCAGCEEL